MRSSVYSSCLIQGDCHLEVDDYPDGIFRQAGPSTIGRFILLLPPQIAIGSMFHPKDSASVPSDFI